MIIGLEAAVNGDAPGWEIEDAVVKIDPPAKPEAAADITVATNQNVTVTATFSGDTVTKQYSLDGETWSVYPDGGVVMDKNGTVYFRAIGLAEKISDVTWYAVTNIDKVAPTKPSAEADITAATNQNVTVTATFSSDSVTKQYSTDSSTWQPYTTGVALSGNGTVYFRGIDEAGNVSDVTEYAVTNIDKVAPTKPSAEADITTVTNQNVTVTATFSADSVKKEYSTDNSTWQVYTTGVVMTANGTVYFRGTDEAGNVSDVTSYAVTNIDKVEPPKPTATADITSATKQNVTVTASYDSVCAIREYSLDSQTWQTYTTGIVMSDNGTVYFRGIDEAGNVSDVTEYAVTNIDKVAPLKPSATADITVATNQNVTVTATYSNDSVTKQYSTDNSTWQPYKDGVVLSENGTVYFRGIDEAGNISDVASYAVANIDKVAPDAPAATADITAATNQNVTVTATFSNDSVTKQYSTDNSAWKAYTTGVVLSENGTVYFRGIDKAGNISEVTECVVANINKVAPAKPTATADISDATNRNVTVTATFSEGSAQKQYSLDNRTWQSYTTGVVLSENGTVYFRGIDAAGNVSDVTSYAVTNIDKVAPTKPTASADVTAATNKDVTVTATFSSDSVTKEYSTDGQNWAVYTTGVVLSQNGTLYFRGTDAAGNVSEVTSYAVANIDKVAPAKPTATADVTAATNQDVTVTATFSSDSVTKEYSTDGQNWAVYTTGVVLSENATVSFRGIDAAGNVSDVTGYAVTNIDKVAPTKPTATADVTAATNQDVTVTATFSGDSVIKEYSLDGETWQAYTTGVVMSENGTVYFRGTDAAGNVSDITSYAVTNIDKVAPDKPIASADITAETTGSVTVTATFSGDSVTKEYSTDNRTWQTYTSGVVMSQNGTVYFRGIDAAGNFSEPSSYAVANIITEGIEVLSISADVTTPTNKDVTVTAAFGADAAKKQYSFDNQTWLDYTSGVVMSGNGTVYFRGVDAMDISSEVKSYTVDNIDKMAPNQPTATADITTATNKDVTVTATFSADSVVKEFSTDNSTWKAYTAPTVLSQNGTVYFRGIDEAGNVSDVTSYAVTNIDKVAPVAPSASADITAATNQDVTVTATYSSDSVTKEYSTDNSTWKAYTVGVVLSDNGTVYFRGTDAAGNVSDVTSYAVTNIDKVAPVAPSASADITAATNQDVTVTATYSSDSVTKEYSTDNSTWKAYTTGVAMSENGTVYFRGTDAAGNVSEVTSYAVTNIDKVAPVAPSAEADITAATNQNVTVTATFGADSVTKQYSTDNQNWAVYTTGVVMSQNGTVYFRGIDEAGNVSDVTSYAVTNIDKVAPVAPSASADITAATNQDVTVTATYSSDSVTKEYSTDNSTWKAYTTGVVLSANGTVYFRGIDAAGNISEVASYAVTNIDKVAPAKPSATADITVPTHNNVTVTAVFGADSAAKQYSTDNSTWQTYTTSVVMTDNGTVYFRGIDEAGNISDVTSYDVTNIDKVPPVKPSATADITVATNKDVTVTATYSSDSVTKQYSTDNQAWAVYTTPVALSQNGTVYFRGIDEAGNISDVTSYTVANIDKVAPVKPTASADITAATNQNVTVTATYSDDSAVKEYSLDNQTWKNYTTGVVVTANGTVYFRGTDAVGNISEVTEFVVSNIDKVPPTKPSAQADITTKTTGNVTVTATYSDDSAVKEYSLDNQSWLAYKSGVVMKDNGTVYFRGTDEAGNLSEVASYTVSNIIVDDFSTGGTVAPGQETKPYTPNLAVSGLYTLTGTFTGSKGSVTIVDKTGKKVATGTIKNGKITTKNALLLDSSNTYKVVVKNTDKKGTASTYTLELKAKELFTKIDNTDDTLKGAKTLAANSTANDWVGYGDAVDYYKLGVAAAGGIYDLNISGVKNNVKLTVYTKNGAKVKTVTASAKKSSVPLANLCLDNGSYAVIEAPKAAKAQNSDYALKFTERATFNRQNNDWSHAEALTADATFAGALTKAAGGDVVDYCDVSALGSLSFKTTAGKVKVSFFDKNKQAVKVAVKAGGKDKTASSVSLTSGKTDNFTIGTLPSSVKYLKIEAAGKTLNSYTIGKLA